MADQSERLLLQVDAATELLRRHLAEGEQPLDRFERRAEKMAENVDRSIGDMGKRFGTFAQLAEDAATRAQRSFEASFSDVQRLAAKAIEAPSSTGGLNVGAADARDAAASAQRQAIATRLIADAAERAAQGEGQLTEQTRLYVQAARAAAIEAERHAQELTREAGALEHVEIELAQAGAGARVFAGSQNRVTAQSGATRAAMQGLSYQVQDTFTQLSMGANVFQVVAIQGGQLAGQFANIEGKAGSFARFMIGPWGLALTGALLVLGPLTKGMFEFGDATDDAVAKLKQDAIESDVTARAKARFAGSVEGLTAALKDQDKALRQTADSERSAAERANINARAKRDEALAIRQKTAAALAEAEAELGKFSLTGGTAGAAALQNQARADRVNTLRAEREKADAAVRDAERQLNVTRVDLAAEQAAIAIDPIRSVTKLYDDRIRALKTQQREEARLGQQVGTASRQRLQQLEAEKKAAIDAAQARQRAASAKPNNNQIGREVDVAEATSIISGIGGRVTSGYRSNADQRRIYADKLAGRHIGPVAKPGTSDHERGQAIDVAYGPGITVASIRQAFAKEGVAIRQLIDERSQRVFHVAFGKQGASQETVARKAELARQKVLNDDIAYGQEEQAARQRLAAATRKSAQGEDARYAELIKGINDEADARKGKIDLQQKKGLSKPRADNLRSLNEQTRKQELQNAAADRALAVLEQRYDADAQTLDGQLALLRIQADMALTERDRRRIATQILDAEQRQRRQALERVRDTSKDPVAVVAAKRSLDALPKLEAAERGQLDQRNEGAFAAYRQRLKATTSDMGDEIEQAAVRGFGALEDSGARATASAVTNLLHLKGVAGDVIGGVIADLARLAIQKAVVAAIGNSFFGLAGGGAIADVPGFGGGGSPGGQISGPGTGTSDSILAILSGGKGAIRVSTKEFIVNAAATERNLPLLHAINSGRVRSFASGGSIGGMPNLPMLRAPSLPAQARGGGQQGQRFVLDGEIAVKASPEFDAKMERVSVRTVSAAAEPIMAGAQGRTVRALRRPSLPGAPG